MSSHTTDWCPTKISKEYRENWSAIFVGIHDDNKQVEAALKYFKQGGCCSSGCNCSGSKPK